MANLITGTMAIAVSNTAAYPRLTFGAGLLSYAMAIYVVANWIKHVRYMRARELESEGSN